MIKLTLLASSHICRRTCATNPPCKTVIPELFAIFFKKSIFKFGDKPGCPWCKEEEEKESDDDSKTSKGHTESSSSSLSKTIWSCFFLVNLCLSFRSRSFLPCTIILDHFASMFCVRGALLRICSCKGQRQCKEGGEKNPVHSALFLFCVFKIGFSNFLMSKEMPPQERENFYV